MRAYIELSLKLIIAPSTSIDGPTAISCQWKAMEHQLPTMKAIIDARNKTVVIQLLKP